MHRAGRRTSSRTSRQLPTLAVLAALGVLPACGTTVPLSSATSTESSAGGAGAAAGLNGPAGGSGPAAGATGLGGPSAVAGSGASAAPAEGSAGIMPVTPAAGTSGTAANGWAGVAHASGPVSIGLLYAKNSQAAINAVGGSNQAPDMYTGMKALVADINAHGGLAGHRIIPVYYGLDATSTNAQAEYQAACTDFTQDHHVFAVAVPVVNDMTFSRCLSQAGVLEVSTELTTENQADFTAAPLLLEPDAINLDRLADIEPRQLIDQGWLANRDDAPAGTLPKPRICVLAFDTPAFREAYQNHLKSTYAQLGAPVYDVQFVSMDTGSLGSEIPQAVLKFEQDQCNHVTFLTTSGLAPGLFAIQASNEHYQPRYGFSSQDAMGVVIQDLPNPRAQLHQSLSVGWFPEADVADYESPANSQPAQPHCLALMRAHQVDAADGNSAGLDDYMCDSIWYLRAALAAEGGQLTVSAFFTGVDRLGSRFRPAVTFADALNAQRRDGLAEIRRAAFYDSCTCFRYTTQGMKIQ